MKKALNILPKKILIVNPLNIGDVVLTGPMVRALKKEYPNASIDLMVTPITEKIAKCLPDIDQVLVYDKAGKHRRLKDILELRAQMHSRHYDLAITIHVSTRSAISTWLSGAKFRIGLNSQGGSLFLTHAIDERTLFGHRAEQLIQLLQPLGISGNYTKLALQVEPKILERVKQKLALTFERPIVLVCPFGNWPQKIWLEDRYRELLPQLAQKAEVFLIGDRKVLPGLEAINSIAGGVAKIWAGDLDLIELVGLIKLATLMLTIDTGPLHIADAVGTPVVSLFGPTEPSCWGPRNENSVVISRDLSCKPCLQRPLCKDNQCMKQISAQEVFEKVDILLKQLNQKKIKPVE